MPTRAIPESDQVNADAVGESAHSAVPATVDGRGDRAVFGAHEELELFTAGRDDTLVVEVNTHTRTHTHVRARSS